MRFRTFGPPSDNIDSLRVTESKWTIDSYGDRDGYDKQFLGELLPLPSPAEGRWTGDLVELVDEARSDGADPTELKYRHFSVRMTKSRRSPLVSAVNIDGNKSKREVERTDVWRRDPRIPNQYQNLREAYGRANEGFFSRGHMTRREDPNWGDDVNQISQADADTFHISNASPQRQGFNAGVWLALEDYVLDNCDQENMRINVLTGPVLRDDDPTYYNVKVPVDFWKILAFTDRNTDRLTTIGYRRSQATYLARAAKSAFVFGDFQDAQVSIASIAEDSGLDLDAYIAFDVFEGAGADFEVQVRTVSDFYLSR